MSDHRFISKIKPDWRREKVFPGHYEPWKRLLATIRKYQKLQGKNGLVRRTLRSWSVLSHHFWSAVSGADIPINTQLGGGLLLPHPNGIVIHPKAEIGPNCLIFQQVTIGTGPIPGVPVLGGHVDVGAGARILGGVRIGDHARIGANAVVVQDVPGGATAVGIPARVVGHESDASACDT